MSRRRYLSTDASTSQKVTRLAKEHGAFAVALWTMVLPHCDDGARLSAEVFDVRTVVIPGWTHIADEEIDAALRGMDAVGLVQLYTVRGKRYLEYGDFYRYQGYIGESRRKSALPGPEDADPPSALEEEIDGSSSEALEAEGSAEPRTIAQIGAQGRTSEQSGAEPRGSAQNNTSRAQAPVSVSVSSPVSGTPETPSPPSLSTDGPERADAADPPRVTAARVMALWNEICAPPLPKALRLHDERRKHVNARAAESGRDEDWWRAYFGRIRASPFLRGEGPPRHDTGKPFQATFDWAVRGETNVAKVLEGNYDPEGGGVNGVDAGSDREGSRGTGASPVRFTEGLYRHG